MNSKSYGILHLSDLHFGKVQTNVLKDLEHFLVARKEEINLVILTGDMTQRAKESEFLAALSFLKKFKHPLFLIPGNHDVPLYNPLLRFFFPYRKFIKYLGSFSNNFYEDEHCAIFGLWTTNNFSIEDGKILNKDLISLEEKFESVSSHKIKIIASHHPLMRMKSFADQNAIERILKLEPHFFLWGHEHQGRVSFFSEKRKFPLLLASGTSISSRTRKEANSFNFINLDQENITVDIFQHSSEEKRFLPIKKFETDLSKEGTRPS